ncbi:MAG TPA: DUF4258 domain-containing protein [Candidatus Acidoferrales bacterium]|nr:DUF4258 domain-containing protein [Candidatus Acidoferrales bacterium]
MARKLIFRVHALQRMFERNITVEDVEALIEGGEVVERYPADAPYPSRLVLGWRRKRPLHVVVAENTEDDQWIVVTAYEPDPAQWDADFKRRKP